MPKETKLELKVGLFVLVALIGLGIFVFSINDSAVFQKGKSITVIFEFADGLKKSAPIRIAGVEAGVVRNIKIFFDRSDGKTKALVEMWLAKEAVIPEDSHFMINQLGLLGEKYVEITPGRDTQNFLEPGRTVIGKTPIPQAYISDQIMDVALQLQKTVDGINKIIADQVTQESIKLTLANLSQLSGNLNDISLKVKSGEGTIGRLFYDDRLYEDFEGMAADLKANPWKLLYRPKK